MSSFGGSFGGTGIDKSRSLVGSRYSEKSLADTNRTSRFENLSKQSEALGKELDLVNQTHWKYNTDQDREFYVNYRLAVQKVYENTPTTIPFKEMIEDPTLSNIKSTRLTALQSKISDLSELLSQANLGVPPASWNPYYDNSALAKPNYEQTRELEQQRERIRDEYDRELQAALDLKKSFPQLQQDPTPGHPYKESRLADWVTRNALDSRSAADLLRAEQQEASQAPTPFDASLIDTRPTKAHLHALTGDNTQLQRQLRLQLAELSDCTRRIKRCGLESAQPTQIRLKDMGEMQYVLGAEAAKVHALMPATEVIRRQEGVVSRMEEYERLAKRAREKRI